MAAKTRLTCPKCNRKSSTPSEMKEGTKVRCPSCQEVFKYVPEVEAIDLAEIAEIEVLPPTGTGRLKPNVVRAEIVPPPVPVQPTPVHSVQMVNVNLPATRKGNSLAVAVLVLGIIAALICWVPFLGLLAIPVALLGAFLGFIGLAIALIGRRSGLSSSLVGTAISLGSIVLSIVITGKTSKSIADAMEKSSREERAVAKAVDNPGQPVAIPTKTKPNGAAEPQRSPVQNGEGIPAIKGREEWVTAPTPAKLGDVIVIVRTAKIDRVPLKVIQGEGQSEEPMLMVNLEITNTNPNRKIDYKSWAGQSISFQRDFATLKDNNGNNYKRISFGLSERPIGRSDSDSIYPEKALGDVLVFEMPLKTAETLDLELPAANVGEKGSFRIRIPAAMIER